MCLHMLSVPFTERGVCVDFCYAIVVYLFVYMQMGEGALRPLKL